MSRKFITLVIAASIAVTGFTAAPARASDRDLARALATIAGIAIVGVAINEARKTDRRAAPRAYYQPQRRAYHAPRGRALERAYRQGFADHRSLVRERRAERRFHRPVYRDQRHYSARPYRY
ncbi:cation:proton antiporter [Roseovarius aquimarinus]|uniref:Uncharacterized protein n=1 Tax=Roseovarius aquimarinus TaxID=1229156 RepID=A0ABW7I946_9RHOB